MPVDPMKRDALTSADFGLLPCPFCHKHLVEIRPFSTRTSVHFTHGRGIPCVLDGLNLIVSERYDEDLRLTLWNTRDGVEHGGHKGLVRAFFNPGVEVL